MEVVNLLQNEPQLFATYQQFLADCASGSLPDYSFVEPNYNDHDGDDGEEVANDQHPDHNIQAGEAFIASIITRSRIRRCGRTRRCWWCMTSMAGFTITWRRRLAFPINFRRRRAIREPGCRSCLTG